MISIDTGVSKVSLAAIGLLAVFGSVSGCAILEQGQGPGDADIAVAAAKGATTTNRDFQNCMKTAAINDQRTIEAAYLPGDGAPARKDRTVSVSLTNLNLSDDLVVGV